MCLAGYVHRDVSPGNCLLCAEGQGKVSDLEYAKHEATWSVHDPITGTKDFTAVEYAQHTYMFQPARTPRVDTTSVPVGEDADSFRQPFDKRVIFNYHHDLESVTWVYSWFLYHRFPPFIYEKLPLDRQAKVQGLCRDGLQYFQVSGGPTGILIRRQVIGAGLSELMERFKTIYEGNTLLADPLALFWSLRNAYQTLEMEPQAHVPSTRNPRNHWPRSSFSLKIYEDHINQFQEVLEKQTRIALTMPVQDSRLFVSEVLEKRAGDDRHGTGSHPANKARTGMK
ncbi:hypothetical protein AAF712_006764 [Marasmius tenuissimus]|uniref:Fungal-type protein kinase domain-containing protein n=1 Tax=Marasmius tenuissimus TaxID=585030 RepID=A0ABR2ZXY4_9AGAR